jgi:hypothetical protein
MPFCQKNNNTHKIKDSNFSVPTIDDPQTKVWLCLNIGYTVYLEIVTVLTGIMMIDRLIHRPHFSEKKTKNTLWL